MQVFIWTGPEAAGGYRVGDVVEILPDGVHPGKRVVTGPEWDSDCQMASVAILDVDGVTEEQAEVAWRTRLALDTRLRSLLRLRDVVAIDALLLPALVRQRLTNRKRSPVTMLQLRDLVKRRSDADDTALLQRYRQILEQREGS